MKKERKISVDELIPLVIDVKQRRPGCVIMQALGGDRGTLLRLFDTPTWILAPTPDTYIVRGTREQWEDFAKECKERFK